MNNRRDEVLVIRLNKQDKDNLKILAQKDRRTMSDYLRVLIEREMEKVR